MFLKSLENKTIMIVDDTVENLKLLERLLRNTKCKIVAFPSGIQALSAAKRNPPDLVLLDINMPEMDGFEVCERMKEVAAIKDVPVIFISALDDTDDKVKAFAVGGVDYVTKPFRIEEVLARVRTHLSLRDMKVELEQHNTNLKQMVQEQIQEISDSQMATIIALASLAESRDDDTGKHVLRTQTFCKMLAEELRNNSEYAAEIDDNFVKNIYYSAPLHDIGKVGIPDKILLKPGALTNEEFMIMKTHTAIGAATLKSAHLRYPGNSFIKMGLAIARSHHEKWDGSGYPDSLVGADIPLCARIMALADVYDALRSKRPYKEPFSHEKSQGIILAGRGTHFDPAVVDAFVSIQEVFHKIRNEWDDEQTKNDVRNKESETEERR